MYPHERSLVQKMDKRPFAIVGINSDSSKEELKKVIEKEHMTWRSWWDGGGAQGPIAKKMNIRGWPTLYVVDHKGIIRHKWLGMPGETVLDEALEKLVSRAEKEALHQ